MGVNQAGFGITDDDVVCSASVQEFIRRYFRYSCEYILGLTDKETVQRVDSLMKNMNIKVEDRNVVTPARLAAKEALENGKGNEGIYCGAAIELEDGTIVTGKNSHLMHAASSLILNATKQIAKIPDDIHLLPPTITDSLHHLKKDIFKRREVSLDLEETLIALSISAVSNPAAEAAVSALKDLKGCEVHMTHMPTPGDEAGLRKLGINLTSDTNFSSKSFFVS